MSKDQQFYRLNLKLDGDLREYLSDEAWRNRTSITALVNQIIREHKDKLDIRRNRVLDYVRMFVFCEDRGFSTEELYSRAAKEGITKEEIDAVRKERSV